MVALDRFGSYCPRGATGRATVSYTGGCSFESSRGRCRSKTFVPTCIGGLTERKGARLLSDGRGQPRQRSIRCPSAQEGMPRWLGAPCFENRYTALPWGFDTSTFRSSSRPVRPAVGRLPLKQRTQVRVLHGSPSAGVAHPGPSSRHFGLRWTTHKESRHASARGMT